MECFQIPEISYGEFSQRMHDLGVNQRLPLAGSLELTERCNLRCAHCYINLPAGDRETQKRELSFKEWTRLLDEMAGEGCLWLLLTGGEPLLRPDFQDLYAHAKRLGMIISLFTNGTLITPKLADFLQDYPPFAVSITVYGHTKGTYEAVTRTPGSYEKCLRGIDLLLARRVPIELKTMVMTLNSHEVWDLKAWAQSLGVEFRYDGTLNARLDGGRSPLALRLSPEEVVALDVRDGARLEEWQRFWDNYGGMVNADNIFTCGAGLDNFHLDPYGQMQVCMMSRTPSYDLRRGSWREGWTEFIPARRRQKPQGDYPCGRCALLNLCGQCPGWACLECGDPEAPVPYLCQIAHLRAENLRIIPR